MIDVVFLLIIFFLVSSHLAKRELHQPMHLPEANTHQASSSSDARLTLNITEDGQISVASIPITLNQLAALIRQRQSDSQNPPAVRIRTDRAVPYDRIEPLLRELTLAGVIDIAFAVEEARTR